MSSRNGGQSITGTSHEASDLSQFASNSFVSLYVAFEGFLSDLFLAYLNRDSSALKADLSSRVSQSVQTKFGKAVSSRTWMTFSRHLSVDTIAGLVDPDARNLEFTSCEAMKLKAKQLLSPVHRSRILFLTAEEERLLDTARAIRHFIAHRSAASKDAMNAKLATVSKGGGNPYLGRSNRKVHDVGLYLRATAGGLARVAHYASGLKAIATKL